MSSVTISLENPDQHEVREMLAASDAYLASLYPAESNHLIDLAALSADNIRLLVARCGSVCMGCGALVLGGDGEAEIKRMWVKPEARRLKLGRRLLQAIEAEARKANVRVLRLETGILQPEAIGLYRSEGFDEIEPFGSYRPDPLSIFMEKRLA